MKQVYLGFGANLGRPVATVRRAIELIEQVEGVEDVRLSRLLMTSPFGCGPQRSFINGVCSLRTRLEPEILFQKIEEIERNLGKVAKAKDAPRPIDIDLLTYGEEVFEGNGLQIPHPRLTERLFVLIPLMDLTEVLHLPQGQVSIRSLIERNR